MGVYEVLSPVFRILPEIDKPARRLSLRERLVWTGLVLVTYLAMSQVPLYGIPWRETGYEQFFFLQVIMASKRGTLMELGIGPIVTAGIIWELLVGSRIINLDLTTKEGKIVFAGVQKLFAIIFAGIEAAAYIIGGAYGPLDTTSQLLVFVQLVLASVIVLLMDEMLQKGWGLGSGISLFIAAGVAQQIFWQLLSPIGPMSDGLLYGFLPATVQAIYMGVSQGNWTFANTLLWRKTGYPDLLGFIATIAFILMLAYFESMRIDVPVVAARYGGVKTRIPLKFLYVSNLPVILVSALYADIHIFARALWPRFNPDNANPWFNIIAMYNQTERGLIPLKGSLVYYISPPRGLYAALQDPQHLLIYAGIFMLLSVLFAAAWVITSGMDPESQAEQLVRSELHIPGFRRSKKVMAAILRRYVWSLTFISGLLVGLIAVIGDMLGVLGSGIGILLMVGILVQYQTILAREQALEMYPVLERILGS